MTVRLLGQRITLRPATSDDIGALVRIRSTPEVHRWWRGDDDLAAEIGSDLEDPDLAVYVIEHEGAVVGAIQSSADEDPDYRSAGIDVFLDPAVHGRGLGTDAVRTLARHLIQVDGHHRLTIDPAAANAAAIACYGKVGFRSVGVLRQYERGADGSWHDGLLMDLLADELT